jgi:hypothetical protein
MPAMKTLQHYHRIFRQSLKVFAILLCGFLAQCAKEETPPPQAETPKPSLVDQYKDTSKESAANPGVAGAPGQMEEEKKSGE